LSARLLLLFFLSGAGALAIETVWMRWLRLLLGATAPAASATLVAFFAGQALGSAWSGRRRWRQPLRAYGRIELAAAATALAVPALLGAGDAVAHAAYGALLEQPAALAGFRFAIALGATLPAAFCFGATFPALGGAAVGGAARLGARGSALYGANTLGAALGTALAVFALPGWIGVRGTYAAGVGLLLMAGSGALILARGPGAPDSNLPAPGIDPHPAGRPALGRADLGLLGLAALSGFGTLALEVLLVQAFAQVLNQSIYAFGAVLVMVLLGLAAGAGAVAWLEARGGLDPRTGLGLGLAATSLAVLAFPAWLEAATGGLEYTGSATPGLAYLGAALLTVVRGAAPALLAASVVLPFTFAMAGRQARGGAGPRVGALIGTLIAANTLGAIAGALAAPYLLMPRFGLWGAFLPLSLAYGVAAMALPKRRRLTRGGLVAASWLGVLAMASPLAVPPVGLDAGERLVAVDTTPAGVVAVVERAGERLIRIDNHYALGGTAEQVHQEREAHLPLVLAPSAERVAYVGSATGISAGGALAHPISALSVVELVPGVASAARRYFAAANAGVYTDPRTHVVLDDARNYLRLTDARFDVVVADLFVPWRAGTGSLYTREHFEAVRAHLEPGGLFCQWLPLYQLSETELQVITATFLDVFPRAALFRGDFYGRFPVAALVGWAGEPAAAEAISAAAAALGRAGVEDRWVADPIGVWALYVGPLGPIADQLVDVARNRDDRPWAELLAARGHAGGRRGKVDPVVGLAWTRFAERLRSSALRVGDPLFELGPAERRAALGGAALQEAGALWSTGRTEAAARAFSRAAALLPPRLVAEATEDPTAAELWAAEPGKRRPR
jgi:spermidine synthase